MQLLSYLVINSASLSQHPTDYFDVFRIPGLGAKTGSEVGCHGHGMPTMADAGTTSPQRIRRRVISRKRSQIAARCLTSASLFSTVDGPILHHSGQCRWPRLLRGHAESTAVASPMSPHVAVRPSLLSIRCRRISLGASISAAVPHLGEGRISHASPSTHRASGCIWTPACMLGASWRLFDCRHR